MPQSISVASPRLPSRMLFGVTSRWTTRRSCAYASASAIDDEVRQQLEPLARARLAVALLFVGQLVEPIAQRDAIDLLEHAERPADASPCRARRA